MRIDAGARFQSLKFLVGIVSLLGISTPSQATTITGVLLDASTNLPIEGFSLVEAFDEDGSQVALGDVNPDTGIYELFLPGPGNYFVRTHAVEYVDEIFDDLPCLSLLCDVTVGTPISVVSGVVGNIDFSLVRGGAIVGRVIDETTGLPIPIPGFSLELYNSDGSLAPARGNLDPATDTFRFSGLVTGSYFVRVRAEGYGDEVYDNLPCAPGSCVITQGTPVSVVVGQTTSDIDFELERTTLVFRDSFESGDTQVWSTSEP